MQFVIFNLWDPETAYDNACVREKSDELNEGGNVIFVWEMISHRIMIQLKNLGQLCCTSDRKYQ